jgi:hypothetical protein
MSDLDNLTPEERGLADAGSDAEVLAERLNAEREKAVRLLGVYEAAKALQEGPGWPSWWPASHRSDIDEAIARFEGEEPCEHNPGCDHRNQA